MTLMEYLKGRKCRGFTPGPRYNALTGTIEVYLADVDFYAESVPDGVTLLRAMDTGEIVGIQVHEAKKLVNHD